MIKLTKKQILQMHSDLVAQTGGIDGIRDESLLDSAIGQPFQSFNGSDLYPSIQAKAARLGFGLVKNHALLDGNKRIGAHAMLVFLALNGIELDYTQKELSNIFLGVADSSVSAEDLLEWILQHQILNS
ncbi:MAG TPA: type II toxin-antitoxin system death-on-curing family toxin [Treponemataceae bacterium]|nr:type II toxin-antitoxin system death-on-curing family toxin [Flavobacterium sp.]HUH43807.1 type II toxin-antitoxin system death-on-curing family toxin [Treponemataceae bacterium]